MLHDTGEGHQQPITISGTSQVPLGVNEVSQVQITNRDHCI